MEATRYPQRLELYVAGERREADGRDTLAVVNPATGRKLGRVSMATTADIDDALADAQAAFLAWPVARAWQPADQSDAHVRRELDRDDCGLLARRPAPALV